MLRSEEITLSDGRKIEVRELNGDLLLPILGKEGSNLALDICKKAVFFQGISFERELMSEYGFRDLQQAIAASNRVNGLDNEGNV